MRVTFPFRNDVLLTIDGSICTFTLGTCPVPLAQKEWSRIMRFFDLPFDVVDAEGHLMVESYESRYRFQGTTCAFSLPLRMVNRVRARLKQIPLPADAPAFTIEAEEKAEADEEPAPARSEEGFVPLMMGEVTLPPAPIAPAAPAELGAIPFHELLDHWNEAYSRRRAAHPEQAADFILSTLEEVMQPPTSPDETND